ncbi:MFS transporter [Bordetella genomosp. 8]|uniref:MFS transporter n=1 Tax=Bordetella genomosp. 8 TaxID=1416806 RepID=A0A1W6YGY1_9BORD|nr:MFS transporter [Bordetella genomosp. 8]ARP79773.1 MFS transporter [Bordetella genomosp. 8]
MPRQALALPLIALTQIIGWGVVSMLPVLARPIALDLRTSLPSVFLGTSVMYMAMGAATPLAIRVFRHLGTRSAMVLGAAGIGAGLGALVLAPGILAYWAAWALIGVAGATFLTTAAYAYIAEYAPDRARSQIGTLMLVTGLAGSIFLPVTAWLEHLIGWRASLLVYVAVMLLVCPLLRFGLPSTVSSPKPAAVGYRRRPRRVFALLVGAIALNSFVTFGIQAVCVPLLQAMGVGFGRAVLVASLLGIFKVAGRMLDLTGGPRWDGLSTGVVAGAMMPLGLAALWLGGGALWPVGVFLLLFGVGSGAFAVARATMPLVFYDKADYAAAMASIALPMNVINALAPPALATSMESLGAATTFALLAGLSAAAFALLLGLRTLRGYAVSA